LVALGVGVIGWQVGMFGYLAGPLEGVGPGLAVLTVDSVPQGAVVITEAGIVGRTPLPVVDPKRLALVLPGHAPAVVVHPATTLRAGPVRLTAAKGDFAVLEIDCGIAGRVIVDGRDVGPQPVFVSVEVAGGTARATVSIETPGRAPMPVDVSKSPLEPWGFARVHAGTGCPPPS
jgi:hypothetical protein